MSQVVGWLAMAVGLLVAVVGISWSIVQGGSGGQPWGSELADNLVFAKSLPLIIGFGILTGFARALGSRRGTERRADGAIRRFHPVTVLNHWINAVGFLLALGTGSVQYLTGVLDVTPPVPLFAIYRLHFVGAALMVFAAAVFVTYRLMAAEQSLVPPPGGWIRHVRGMAHELPSPLRRFVGYFFGLDMRRQPPPVEQFTYYEKVVSFPIWFVLLALILVTGLTKAMRYVVPIPGEVVWWASALHVAAMVLLAAKLLDHLRYVLAPGRWPLLRAMFTTWVSARYVQLRHPGWYRVLAGQAARPVPATRSQVGAAPERPAAPVSGGGE